MKAHYIQVEADVRYWDDAEIDGTQDVCGLIPLRKGDAWCPVIELATGRVLGWPEGVTADVHYKVCDAGLYWLLDADKKCIATWSGYYVPNDILCVGDNGYGDYIIFKIGADGLIKGWRVPVIDPTEWELEDKPEVLE